MSADPVSQATLPVVSKSYFCVPLNTVKEAEYIL